MVTVGQLATLGLRVSSRNIGEFILFKLAIHAVPVLVLDVS
jgi:hypothetical protein